jgi:polysaccharide biosynthesis transport protein
MTAPAKNKIKSTAITLVLAGAGIAALALIYLFLTPKFYRATAMIKLEKRDWSQGHSASDVQNPYDPHLAPAECQVLRSNSFMQRVVDNLDLSHAWGKRYNQGNPLTGEQALERLRSKTDIHPVPSSTLFEIVVTSEDRDETAKIANEFANLYMDYSQSQRKNAIQGKIDALQHQWADESKKVQEAQFKVNQMALEINRGRIAQPTNQTAFYDLDNYRELQEKRIELETQTVQLRDELKELESLQPSDLRQALSSLDPETNSTLNASLIQFRKVKNDLAAAEIDHGPDSTEYKHAQQLVNELDHRIDREVRSIMTLKEANLAANKAALDAFDERFKQVKIASQMTNTAFAEANRELQKAQEDREALRDKMSQIKTDEVVPVTIAAEVVDHAEVPSKPSIPDRLTVLCGIGGGGLLAFAGLALLLVGQRTKRPQGNK